MTRLPHVFRIKDTDENWQWTIADPQANGNVTKMKQLLNR